MYIARVVHVFRPEVIGDPFYSHELSLRQAARGHRVNVITWTRRKVTSREKTTRGFEIYRLNGVNFGLKGKISKYPYLPCLSYALEKIKPDIIHAHSHLFLTTYFAVKTAKKLGIPSIVTVHGVIAKRNVVTDFLQYSYCYTFASQLFNNNTITICLTRSDAEQITHFGCPRDKIRIVPNPVDTKLFKPILGIEEDNLVVWVGRFVPEKGLNYLIEAARIVVSSKKNVKFLLVGGGPLRSSLNYLIRTLNLDDNVSIIGPIEHEKIAKILARASIFAFPSIKEGMPKALLEAMSAGKAIVASNISGIREIIENEFNCILVPPKNANALAKKLISLLEDKPLRNKLSRNARETVLKKFTWDRVLNQLDSIYQNAIEEM